MTQRMRLMPEVATAENGLKGALSGEFRETIIEMDGDGNEQTRRVPVSWTTIKDIYRAAIAASPNGGCVTDADLERAAEAHWSDAVKDWGLPAAWSELSAGRRAERIGSMRVALAVLGLPLASEPPPAATEEGR